MAGQMNRRQVQLAENGEVVAVADIQALMDGALVRATLHPESGHLPRGTRRRLVDVVLDLPEARGGDRLEATLPLGDAESLERLRERCHDMEARPAGATCLVDAALPRSAAGGRKPA